LGGTHFIYFKINSQNYILVSNDANRDNFGVGGLIFVIFFTIILIHRIKKSNEGSYIVPWEAARTTGGLSYVGKNKNILNKIKIIFFP